MRVVTLQNLPKEFKKPRKEPNLLTYKDFEIIVLVEEGRLMGSVRIGISTTSLQEGLIADLFVDNSRLQGEALQNHHAQLLKRAESILKKKGVGKVDAYYLDGPGKLEHYYSKGYVPERRTVEIEWDLVEHQKLKIKNQKYKLTVKSGSKDTEELEELLLDSFQPYWTPWGKTRLPRFARNDIWWVAYKEGQAIGMVDQDLEIGVIIRKSYSGGGLGSFLLKNALQNLRKRGKNQVSILITSGLDDYDPQIYLYTMNGGKIVREYINLNKTF